MELSCPPHPSSPLVLYVEFYDCEGNIAAVALLDDVEVEGSGTIVADLTLQGVDRLCRAKVSLFSDHSELWSTEVALPAHSY